LARRVVLESRIQIAEANLGIIGVAQPHFLGENVGEAPDLWIPTCNRRSCRAACGSLTIQAASRKELWLHAIGRLKPAVSRLQAQANVDVVFKQIVAEEFSKISQSNPD